MRYDNIEYNDEWQSVPVVRAEPVTEDYNDIDEVDYDTYSGQSEGYKDFSEITKYKKSGTPQPVIKLQFLLSIAVLVLAFLLKNYGGNMYATVRQWYFTNLNNSLVVTMNTENNMLPTDTQTENQTEQSSQAVTQAQQYTQPSQAITEPVTEATTEPTTEQTEATQALSEEVTQVSTEETEDDNEY